MGVDFPFGMMEAEWSENQSITFDDASPAKTVEGKGTVDLAASGYIKILVQLDITFGNAADGNAEVRVRASPDSGTTKDTVLFYSFDVPFTINTQKIVSFELKEVPYVEIGIYNGNAAVQDITIAAVYAGMKYKSG